MEEFYLDAILMPLSLFLVVGYHVYLWQCLKTRPWRTTMGTQSEARRAWLDRTLQGCNEVANSMQLVQSFRNNLMIIILRASTSIIVSLAAAALSNNAYKAATARHGFESRLSGLFAVKYATAFVVSVWSFLCSSFGVGFLVDTSMLVSTATASTDEVPYDRPNASHIKRLVETGFVLAFIGNRLLWLTFAVLLWSFGPVAVALCSLALVWAFSVIDFVGKSV